MEERIIHIHFHGPLPMEVTLSGMPRRNTMSLKSSRWNLGKPGGWEAYKELTDEAANNIKKIVQNDDLDIDQKMKKIESIDTQIKCGAFGKTRCNKTKHKIKVRGDATDLELLKSQSNKIEQEILKLKSQKLGRVGSIFKMKEVINGPKKAGQEPTAIKDPVTGDLVVSNEEIKRVTLEYCKDNLTKKSLGREAQIRNDLNKLRMADISDDEEFEIVKSDFEGVLNKCASKTTKVTISY